MMTMVCSLQSRQRASSRLNPRRLSFPSVIGEPALGVNSSKVLQVREANCATEMVQKAARRRSSEGAKQAEAGERVVSLLSALVRVLFGGGKHTGKQDARTDILGNQLELLAKNFDHQVAEAVGFLLASQAFGGLEVIQGRGGASFTARGRWPANPGQRPRGGIWERHCGQDASLWLL
jgi:hypothetical protein